MELVREEKGFIDLEYLLKNGAKKTIIDDESYFIIEYNDKKYYFKPSSDELYVYNELIAEELAKDLNIKCAHYDIAKYNDKLGVISEDIFDKTKGIILEELVNKYNNENKNNEEKNNLEDLWNIFYLEYKDNNIVYKLTNDYVNVFIFDVLIANIDRHLSNSAIRKNNDELEVVIFDNELMLNEASISLGGYSLGVEENDDFFKSSEYDPNEEKFLHKFLRISDKSYKNLINENLWVISDENIDNAIKKVENRTKSTIPNGIKKYIKDGFRRNNEMIGEILEETNNKRM